MFGPGLNEFSYADRRSEMKETLTEALNKWEKKVIRSG